MNDMKFRLILTAFNKMSKKNNDLKNIEIMGSTYIYISEIHNILRSHKYPRS